MTMTLISTATVGVGGAASIDFTSIPQDGTDLLVLISSRTTNTTYNEATAVQFNGVITGYTNRNLIANATTITSNTIPYPGRTVGATATSNTFGNESYYISNYSVSTNKSLSADAVGENNATTADRQISAQTWANTAVITSISLIPTASFVQYSTASLYKITKGSDGITVVT